MPKFQIQQIAICHKGNDAHHEKAMALLADLGLTEWALDTVTATGEVFGKKIERSVAELSFNYQAGGHEAAQSKPLELEMLRYKEGENWMDEYQPRISHLGMHVTDDELWEFIEIFIKHEITVAQALATLDHTNPVIRGKRKYRYVIFNTYELLGVDLKFIVREYVTQEELGDLVTK